MIENILGVDVDLEKLEKKYYRWLVKRIKWFNGKTYNKLFKSLYQKTFYPIVRMDENREGDGRYLRCEWNDLAKIFEIDYTNWDTVNDLFGACKVLEMMIAFAYRFPSNIGRKFARAFEDVGLNNLPGIWDEERYTIDESCFFWFMIKNVGLYMYDDECYSNRVDCIFEVNNILDRMLERRYDGITGCLFPYTDDIRLLREEEIWLQATGFSRKYWD